MGSKEPDRVFGLRDTNVFKQQAATLGGLRRSPFKDGKVLYPFLIVEAKSEKGSRGFDSIENQTAFPIRTLLKLQHDLGATSENEINPLVWFLANQGEEWRVYGSILDDSKWVWYPKGLYLNQLILTCSSELSICGTAHFWRGIRLCSFS